MSAAQKTEVLTKVAASRAPIRQVLRQLGVPKSTYYRWRSGTRSRGRSSRRVPWNRITREEEQKVLAVARASPEWSSRQIAPWVTDYEDFSVSESTVYRILKREGLVSASGGTAPASRSSADGTVTPGCA